MLHSHYFLAIRLPEEIYKKVSFLLESFQHSLSFKKWVHPADYHITLAFLGHPPGERHLEELDKRIGTVILKHEIFDLNADHIGIFGNQSFPRIFWLGLKDSLPLQKLQEQVFEACILSGFELDKKTFRPHITVARKWNDEEEYKEITELSADIKKEALKFTVENVQLLKTSMKQTPKYETCAVYQLQRSKDK
ncbi:RNA 2',3'-cyclic phosphodiesterase [Metabacillus sp. RGM 3146]|uniref:RNA 2',3'-cyclic phosphodiesterase n=1 Tax=Metabacillus sp. RGM 3146 TaxID=3401092 RepID=UPI003B9ABE11